MHYFLKKDIICHHVAMHWHISMTIHGFETHRWHALFSHKWMSYVTHTHDVWIGDTWHTWRTWHLWMYVHTHDTHTWHTHLTHMMHMTHMTHIAHITHMWHTWHATHATGIWISVSYISWCLCHVTHAYGYQRVVTLIVCVVWYGVATISRQAPENYRSLWGIFFSLL